MQDEQNVVLKMKNGNLATTSYGPRRTDSRTTSSRPMSWSERELVIQMDGDVSPSVAADFVNQTMTGVNKGCFISHAVAYSDTGATISVVPTDSGGGTSAPIALAPAAGQWIAARDIDISTVNDTQFAFTIGAGETATVVIYYLAAEVGVDGVLAKAEPGYDSVTI